MSCISSVVELSVRVVCVPKQQLNGGCETPKLARDSERKKERKKNH
jgi:hypothetical protein